MWKVTTATRASRRVQVFRRESSELYSASEQSSSPTLSVQLPYAVVVPARSDGALGDACSTRFTPA